MENKLRLIKLNLLWLFKYHCDIPSQIWFAMEYIPVGSQVYVTNWRLHIVEMCKVDDLIKSGQQLINVAPMKPAQSSYFIVRDAKVWNLKG